MCIRRNKFTKLHDDKKNVIKIENPFKIEDLI